MRTSISRFLGALALLLVAAMPLRAHAADLLQVIARQPELSMYARAVKAAGMEQQLRSGSFTVLAPTNSAFLLHFGAGDIDQALSPDNRAQLRALLMHMTTRGYRSLPTPGGSGAIPMLDGGRITLGTDTDGQNYADDARVVAPAILAGNGLILEVDSVIFPPR